MNHLINDEFKKLELSSSRILAGFTPHLARPFQEGQSFPEIIIMWYSKMRYISSRPKE
jgi:hypothetical protein